MSHDDHLSQKPSRFASTRWSVVLAAGNVASPQSHQAMAALCETYWYPLYAYVRRRGYDSATAEDLTQAFFTRLLDKGDLGQVCPERGRFRSFLLASMKHFLANEWDRTQAAKRGGGRSHFSIDSAGAEQQSSAQPEQSSPLSQTPSPHTGGQMPQSSLQFWQFSLASHTLSPQ